MDSPRNHRFNNIKTRYIMRQYTQTKGYSVKALLEIADRFGYIVECYSNHSTLHPGYYLCARQGVLRSPYPRRIYSYNFSPSYYERLKAQDII